MSVTETITGILLALAILGQPVVLPILAIKHLAWCRTRPAIYFKVDSAGFKRKLFICCATFLELCLLLQLLFGIVMLLLITGQLELSWPLVEKFQELFVFAASFGSFLNVFTIWFTTMLLWDRKYSLTRQQS